MVKTKTRIILAKDFDVLKKVQKFAYLSTTESNVVIQTTRTKLEIQIDPNQLSSTVAFFFCGLLNFEKEKKNIALVMRKEKGARFPNSIIAKIVILLTTRIPYYENKILINNNNH